jgi:hypothetical protein
MEKRSLSCRYGEQCLGQAEEEEGGRFIGPPAFSLESEQHPGLNHLSWVVLPPETKGASFSFGQSLLQIAIGSLPFCPS